MELNYEVKRTTNGKLSIAGIFKLSVVELLQHPTTDKIAVALVVQNLRKVLSYPPFNQTSTSLIFLGKSASLFKSAINHDEIWKSFHPAWGRSLKIRLLPHFFFLSPCF